MVEKEVADRKLYKIPSDEILENRREFYGLKRTPDESIEQWLNRVFGHIDACDFPKSVEYILTDKFVCELDDEERKFIRKADPNWSMQCEIANETSTTDDVDPPIELDSSTGPNTSPSPSPCTSASLNDDIETTLEDDDVQVDLKADDAIDVPIKRLKRKKCNAEHPVQKHIKTEKRYPCRVCDKSFLRSRSLKSHALTHKKSKMVFCNCCHMGFKRLDRLIEHKRKQHTHIGGKHSCRVCGKRFKSVRELRRHDILHIGKKPYECSVCRKGFYALYYLKQHTKVMHHGFRPYPCGICGEKLRSAYMLKKHLDVKHPGKNPHICDLCDKTFIKAAAVMQHKRMVHEPNSNEEPAIGTEC